MHIHNYELKADDTYHVYTLSLMLPFLIAEQSTDADVIVIRRTLAIPERLFQLLSFVFYYELFFVLVRQQVCNEFPKL